MKRALITGCAGQDGTYLSRLLLSKGYEVFGLCHRMPPRVEGVVPIYGDLRDRLSVETAFQKSNPDEVYNLGGQVFVPTSWNEPTETLDVNVGGLSRILEVAYKRKTPPRIYQASTSEMFGNSDCGSCNEESPMEPQSPYGVSKLAAHRLVSVYRQKGMFVVSGILFNHESPLRGREMVTRKIACHVARWQSGKYVTDKLVLGNLQAARDWGFAGDYVDAMYAMLQQPVASDYVVGTGVTHTVEEFVRRSLDGAGLAETYMKFVESAPDLMRTGEIHRMYAEAGKARRELHWWPRCTFGDLVWLMVRAEIDELHKQEVNRGSDDREYRQEAVRGV